MLWWSTGNTNRPQARGLEMTHEQAVAAVAKWNVAVAENQRQGEELWARAKKLDDLMEQNGIGHDAVWNDYIAS